jgi:DNA-binding MarR family transcriptional regulator
MTTEVSAAQSQTLLSDLLAFSMLMPSALDEALRAEANLPLFEFTVLAVLARAPERTATMSRVAESTHSSPSRLSHAASRLEARGLMERGACATDRRSVNARLTDAGALAVECAIPVYNAHLNRLVVDRLCESDQGDLARLLRRLLEGGVIGAGSCESADEEHTIARSDVPVE